MTPHAAPHPRVKPARVAIPTTLAFPTVSVLTLFSISAEVVVQTKRGKALLARRGVKIV